MASHISVFKNTGRLHWYHWVVVIASLVLTLSAWHITKKQAERQTQRQFEFQAKQIIGLVQERLEMYEEALWSGVAALHALPPNAQRSDWRRFANSLKIEDRYPGINGIGVIHYVPEKAVDDYLAWMQQEMPTYRIHPAHTKNEFWPISYVEPQGFNDKAIGLDMAHEINRYTAAKKTARTGTAQITGPIILVQDAKKTPGFLFFVPWYKGVSAPRDLAEREDALLGLVYAPFIAHKLMDGTLANTNRKVNFSIHDGETELYNELTPESEDYDVSPLYSTFVNVDLYGRQWRFTVQSSTLFRADYAKHEPLIILIGGLLIDSLLFVLFVTLTRINHRVLAYADEVTEDLQKNQKELNYAAGRLDSTMNAIMDGVVVIDERGNIQFINSAIEAIFGYSEDALVGKNISCLMPEPHAKEHDSYLARKTPEDINPMLGKERKLLALHADGSTFPIRLNVSKGEDEHGEFYTGVIHDLRDLDASQLQLERSERLVQVALFQSSTPTAMLDVNFSLIEVNPALCEWLGYSYETLIGRSVKELVVSAFKDAMLESFADLFEGKVDSQTIQTQYRHKQGRYLWCLAATTLIPQSEGALPILFVQFTNIQPMKELEIELSIQNQHLEEANAELNQFSYIAAHDLKEPLRTLRTFTAYLLKDLEAERWERVAQDIHHVETAALRMTDLVNGLLDLSRAGNMLINQEPIQSSVLIEHAKDNLRRQLEEKEAHLHIEGENLFLRGNAVLLTQVVQNLISNALKFHLPDQAPEVYISTEDDHLNKKAVIRVWDNGVGIPEEHRKNIFLAFKRLHSTAEYPGTGIGLAIVKKIIDRHEGTIEVGSGPSGGAAFCIRLPRSSSVERGEGDHHSEMNHTNRKSLHINSETL